MKHALFTVFNAVLISVIIFGFAWLFNKPAEYIGVAFLVGVVSSMLADRQTKEGR